MWAQSDFQKKCSDNRILEPSNYVDVNTRVEVEGAQSVPCSAEKFFFLWLANGQIRKHLFFLYGYPNAIL